VTIWLGENRARECSPAADNPTHRRIMPQTLGVVHILVSGKPTKDVLPQHPDKSMPATLAGSPIRERLPGHRTEAKGSSGSRYASNQTSEVTTEPRNWSINRRSKSSLKAPSFDSPAGSAMIEAAVRG
jgi:hypothetical protein